MNRDVTQQDFVAACGLSEGDTRSADVSQMSVHAAYVSRLLFPPVFKHSRVVALSLGVRVLLLLCVMLSCGAVRRIYIHINYIWGKKKKKKEQNSEQHTSICFFFGCARNTE